MKVKVVKASGKVEPFSRTKVVSSLVRSGVKPRLADKIVDEVSKSLPPVITTEDLYHRLLSVLRERDPSSALRYVLKKAIMMLGPEGYPFERYFAKLLAKYGYKTRVDVVVRGRCVAHEIDVVAEKGGKRYMIECKYHNSPGKRTDVQVALYVYARFLDLSEKFDAAWIATNTRLTLDAARYAKCVGMITTAWRYPPGSSLERMIEETGLYPITILTTLHGEARQKLLRLGVVTLEDLKKLTPSELARLAGITPREAEEVLLEAALL